MVAVGLVLLTMLAAVLTTILTALPATPTTAPRIAPSTRRSSEDRRGTLSPAPECSRRCGS